MLHKITKGAGSKENLIWEQGAQNLKKGAANNWEMEQGAREIIREQEEIIKRSREQREMEKER